MVMFAVEGAGALVEEIVAWVDGGGLSEGGRWGSRQMLLKVWDRRDIVVLVGE